MPTFHSTKSVLLIGASRGLGYALAAEYLQRGCHLVATVRGRARTKLHDRLGTSSGQLEIETADINFPDQTMALHTRLRGRTFDLLFVNAGVKNDDRETIADVATDEFVRVMVTNALSPMRVVESFQGSMPRAERDRVWSGTWHENGLPSGSFRPSSSPPSVPAH